MKNSQKPINHIKNKHTDDLVDHYWGSINYVYGLIKSSELKAGLILSFYGILFNFIYRGTSFLTNKPGNNIFIYIILGLWLCSTGLSIYYSVRCFIPRIERKFNKNVFFFGDIISKFGEVREFSRTFYEISINEERLFQQLGQQIFVLSKIASIKFKNVRRSLKMLGAALLFLLLLILYHLLFIFFSFSHF